MFEVTILTAVLILRLHSMVSLLCIDTALREYHRTPLVKSGNGDDPCRRQGSTSAYIPGADRHFEVW